MHLFIDWRDSIPTYECYHLASVWNFNTLHVCCSDNALQNLIRSNKTLCIENTKRLLELTFWVGAGILAWGGIGGDIPPLRAFVWELVTDRRSSGMRALAFEAMLECVFSSRRLKYKGTTPTITLAEDALARVLSWCLVVAVVSLPVADAVRLLLLHTKSFVRLSRADCARYIYNYCMYKRYYHINKTIIFLPCVSNNNNPRHILSLRPVILRQSLLRFWFATQWSRDVISLVA